MKKMKGVLWLQIMVGRSFVNTNLWHIMNWERIFQANETSEKASERKQTRKKEKWLMFWEIKWSLLAVIKWDGRCGRGLWMGGLGGHD